MSYSAAMNRQLADELAKLGLADMAANAKKGMYGDFTSWLAMPKATCVDHLRIKAEQADPDKREAIMALRKRVMDGDFDG